jgi:isochorismate synthase
LNIEYSAKKRAVGWDDLDKEINFLDYQQNKEANNVTQIANYKLIVEKAIKDIQQGKYEKIVLSRYKIIEGRIDLLNSYKNLCKIFPNYYCYILFHAEWGIWCGASPETLLKVENKKGYTVSLAGTKKQNIYLSFTEKEKKEQ